MARQVVRIKEGDPREAEFRKIAEEALKPENLTVVARGPENRKDPGLECIEKYGMYFYITGHVPGDGAYSVYRKTNYEECGDELCTALKNTASRALIGTMDDAVFGGMKKVSEFVPDGIQIYVLTNEEKFCGAGVMLCDGVFLTLKQKLGNFWIIPSSVHELLILPVSDEFFMDKETVVQMVKDVNHCAVIPEDRLVDNAFFYDGRIH